MMSHQRHIVALRPTDDGLKKLFDIMAMDGLCKALNVNSKNPYLFNNNGRWEVNNYSPRADSNYWVNLVCPWEQIPNPVVSSVRAKPNATTRIERSRVSWYLQAVFDLFLKSASTLPIFQEFNASLQQLKVASDAPESLKDWIKLRLALHFVRSNPSLMEPVSVGLKGIVWPSLNSSQAGLRISQDFHAHHDRHDDIGRRASLHHNSTVSAGYVQPGSQPVEGSILDSEASLASFSRTMEEYKHPALANSTHQNSEPGTIRLAMDSSKTDRYEWVNVVYDTIFDPSVAYEFQFQWLTCTGCVLSDFITQLTRKAKSFGFSLIQIPVKHDIVHSFLSPRKDSFAWSELSIPHQQAVCNVLVKVLDFLPRKRPNQFIHRSGVIIIDISNNIFQWTVNWTDVNAYTTAQNYQLLRRFRDFMTQVTLLKQQSATPGGVELSYSEFVAGLVQKVAPFSAQSLLAPSLNDSALDA